MKLIKRLTTSVTATLDNTVSRIENHDAIVEATIKQSRQAVAKTKARINTLRQQKNAYQQQLQEARDQHTLWSERALRFADSDQDKALQCIRRRNLATSEINRLAMSIEQQKELIEKVTVNLQKLQRHLDDTAYKHNLMRSRQSVAEVSRAVARANDDTSLNDTFERWEAVVFEHELAINDACVPDALAHELDREEQQQELLMQLSELRSDASVSEAG